MSKTFFFYFNDTFVDHPFCKHGPFCSLLRPWTRTSWTGPGTSKLRQGQDEARRGRRVDTLRSQSPLVEVSVGVTVKMSTFLSVVNTTRKFLVILRPCTYHPLAGSRVQSSTTLVGTFLSDLGSVLLRTCELGARVSIEPVARTDLQRLISSQLSVAVRIVCSKGSFNCFFFHT